MSRASLPCARINAQACLQDASAATAATPTTAPAVVHLVIRSAPIRFRTAAGRLTPCRRVGVLQDQRHLGELVTATRAAAIGHDQHDLTDKRPQLQPEGEQGP